MSKGKIYRFTFQILFRGRGAAQCTVELQTAGREPYFIYTELRSRGYRVDVGVVEAYETNPNGKAQRKQLEVDFIANKGSRKYYIQSAFEMASPEKIEQEKNPLTN